MRPSALPLRHDCCDYSGRPIGGAKPKGKFSRMPEVAQRQGLVRNVHDVYAHQDARLITPALLAYAHYLEDDGHYVEALDVLETMLRVAERQMRDADRIATALRVGRVNRKMHRFDEAERWYTEAGDLASRVGDRFSVLLSRLGHANEIGRASCRG